MLAKKRPGFEAQFEEVIIRDEIQATEKELVDLA